MSTTPIAVPATPAAVPPPHKTLFEILQFVLGLTPSIVQGIAAFAVPGATKKSIATGMLGAAFQGLAVAHQIEPNNQTLTLVNQLTDVGIETAVSVLNNPPATAAPTAAPAPATS